MTMYCLSQQRLSESTVQLNLCFYLCLKRHVSARASEHSSGLFQELRYTGCTQKNGAISKANKKFISRLTRAQRTPSAAAAIQVSRALPAVRFSCLLRGRRASFQDGVAAGKGFLCAPFEVSRSVITVQREFCAQFRTAGAGSRTADGLRCARVR
jgi:hypothetical protein